MDKNIIDFKFSKSEYDKLINNIKIAIKENKETIQKANEIDLKYSNKKVDIDIIMHIIEQYRNDEIKNEQKLRRYLVEYNGDIYITIQLCLWAILNKVQIALDTNDFMLGVNNIIVDIINQSLKEYGIKDLIKICNLLEIEVIKLNANRINKILCIDDIDIYNEFQDLKIRNIEFIKFDSIDLYCDDDDLVELRDMICDYARDNHRVVEIYDDIDKNEVIDAINKHGNGAIAVLLSNDELLQKEFEQQIKNKKKFINKNPIDETNKISIN